MQEVWLSITHTWSRRACYGPLLAKIAQSIVKKAGTGSLYIKRMGFWSVAVTSIYSAMCWGLAQNEDQKMKERHISYKQLSSYAATPPRHAESATMLCEMSPKEGL
jgi:hypothetical protein